jgi:hypothetical protein
LIFRARSGCPTYIRQRRDLSASSTRDISSLVKNTHATHELCPGDGLHLLKVECAFFQKRFPDFLFPPIAMQRSRVQ